MLNKWELFRDFGGMEPAKNGCGFHGLPQGSKQLRSGETMGSRWESTVWGI